MDGGNPAAVLAACQERLAKLHALRQSIHHDDRQLLAAAGAIHDHHNAQRQSLHDEIRRLGVGADPTLENAYGHHLEQRQVAEETAHTLHKRVANFDPDL